MWRVSRFAGHHPLLAGILLAGVAALGILAVLRLTDAPMVSGVGVMDCRSGDSPCVRFPVVTGTNLLGESVTIPDNPDGLTLVLLSFDEAQTRRTAAWLPLAQALASAYPTLAYYNVPTLKAVTPLARVAITGGMVIAVPAEVHAMTVMLFLEDKQLFLDALEIHNIDALQALLLNSAGEVIWRARGDYSDAVADELRAAVSAASTAGTTR